jgi:hypothetical protein
VENYDEAITGELNVEFNAASATIASALEGSEGVFRRVSGSPASPMAPH